MNSVIRFIRSMRAGTPADQAFENYYGSLIRQVNAGGPSATEARRDFAAVRSTVDRLPRI